MNAKDELAQRLESGRFEEALQVLVELKGKSSDPAETAGYLIDEATCYWRLGNTSEAQQCIDKARLLIASDALATAQVDFFVATLLLEDEKREKGLEVLSSILNKKLSWIDSNEGRELYGRIQAQRAFSMIHAGHAAEAQPILEEALSLPLDTDTKSSAHCHLGRIYHEDAQYKLAKEHFNAAQLLGIPEDWAGVFHYYFGYTLYELREFNAARREFILSLQSGLSGPPASYKYKMLAATHRKLGEHSDARRYEELAKLDEPR